MIKILLSLIFLIFSCVSDKKESTNHKVLTYNNEIPKADFELLNSNYLELKVCDTLIYEDINLPYATFFKDMKRLEELKLNTYYKNRLDVFNKIFHHNNINCVLPYEGDHFLIYEIRYDDNVEVEKIYTDIIQLNINYNDLDDTYGYYHDFFKTGFLFILNSEENKITYMTFNIFADNSLPKKVRTFFKQNENAFEKVFMTTGIGTVEILVE